MKTDGQFPAHRLPGRGVLQKVQVNRIAVSGFARRNVQDVAAGKRYAPVGAAHDGWPAFLKTDEDVIEAHRLRAEYVRKAQADAARQQIRPDDQAEGLVVGRRFRESEMQIGLPYCIAGWVRAMHGCGPGRHPTGVRRGREAG